MVISRDITVFIGQTPSNDLCQNAISLNVVDENDGNMVFDLSGATSSGLGPSCSDTTYNDIWFQVIVPTCGYVFIDINDWYRENGFVVPSTLQDLKFEAYTGVCNNLSLVQNQFGFCEFGYGYGMYYEGSGTLYISFQGTNAVTLLEGFVVNDQCFFLTDLDGCN